MLDGIKRTRTRAREAYGNWRARQSDGQFAMLRSTALLAAAAVLAGAGYLWARPAWDQWRHRKAMAQAIEYAERRDYANTMLSLKRATELAPLDLATWRRVSRQLAELGSPETIVARENVVRLDPGDQAMRLALVADALRFGRIDLANTTLEGVGGAARGDAAFHRLAAAVALATGEQDQLKAHLEALVAAAPDDSAARFNLAAIRLWGGDEAEGRAALLELERLTLEPAARVRAGLELLKHAARTRDAGRARIVTDLLLSRLGVRAAAVPGANGEPPGWAALLQGLQDAAVQGGAADVALVAGWLGDVRLSREALVWLDGLPKDIRSDPAVLRAGASLSAGIEDYDRLEPLLRAGGLGPIPPDAVRLALAAQVQRVRYQKSRGRGTWEDAISACGESVNALTGLATLAEIWRDAEGNERVLQEILRRQPKTHWVYLALRNLYASQAATEKLWQLHGGWAQVRPDDPRLAQTWLSLGILLDKVPSPAAQAAIRRAGEPGSAPLDRALAAALLWRAGRRVQALEMLDTLPGEVRTRADIAFWRAIVLADEPARAEEARAAAAAARRPGLLPEEAHLLETAERKAGRFQK